ncbi:MAG: alpha/beta hydrolase family protein [Candidatus Poribacteria bacterium]
MQTFNPYVDGYYDVADQLKTDLYRRAKVHFDRQCQQKAKLKTIDAFEQYRAQLKERFLRAIGGLPQERTPLNPQCTGIIDRGNFVIEKIIYESLPEFYVTSALYLPKGITQPTPAVVFVHGHSDLGKSYPVYQAVCVDLVNNGFVVFAIDPPGQGERFQYYDAEKQERIIGGCTTEHTHAGLQFVIRGASVARHFIWDVMRGLDYLEIRPEVDNQRIGLTGNSGGGTQSCLLMMSEPRFAAAVPCTFVMTLESYMKTGQPQDSEQIVQGGIAYGPDHDDYLTAMAPKPVLVGAAAYDYFPIEGALEAVRRAKRIYALYGAEDKVDITVAPTRHSYSPYLRQACVNWYKKHFRNEPPDFKTGEPQTLPENELWCTPNGQILDRFPNSKTVFHLNRASLPKAPPKLKAERDFEKRRDEMRNAVLEVLGINDENRSQPIYPRIIAENEVDGYRTEKIFFFSAPDIVVTGVMAHPKGDSVKQTDLVLFENGTKDIPEKRDLLTELLENHHRLFVFDARGVGAVEMRQAERGRGVHAAEYKFGCDAMMLGKSTLGLRVFDVLRGYDYLRTRRDVENIGILGVGSGAFLAYFAAAIEDGFTDQTFTDLLYSYRNLAETRYYNRDIYNLHVMAYGILQRFDLVDLLPCLYPRKTQFINPRNAKGELLSEEDFREKFLNVGKEMGYLKDSWTPVFSEG